MKRLFRRFHRDQRGASLILAIGVVVVLGALSGGLLPFISSGLKDRTVLDGVRNRQYSADGAVEYSIARVRSISNVGLASCGGPDLVTTANRDAAGNFISIRVDCANNPTVATGSYIQQNVIFAACLNTGVACTEASTIVRAQVNFQSAGTTVTRTWIQSWSVNQ